MFQKIPGEFEKIRWNVREGSGERSRRFRGIFKKIPGNFENKSEEWSNVTLSGLSFYVKEKV